MSNPESAEITRLLKAWGNGDQGALDALTPLVYDQLRRLARHYARGERGQGRPDTGSLVHEAYLRLINAGDVDWQDRTHFFAVSARIMRRILVDAARTRGAAKRGGGQAREEHSTAIDLDAIPLSVSTSADELFALDEALTRLTAMDARRAQVIELRFFGGLSVGETADVLKVSPQTVMRDWRLARAWLIRELSA